MNDEGRERRPINTLSQRHDAHVRTYIRNVRMSLCTDTAYTDTRHVGDSQARDVVSAGVLRDRSFRLACPSAIHPRQRRSGEEVLGEHSLRLESTTDE